MQILKKLKQKPYANDLHFFVILIVLFLISNIYPIFYILLFIYLIFTSKRFNILYPSILILFILFIRIIMFTNSIININNNDIIPARVIDKTNYGYVIKIDNTKIEVTDYYNSYLPGDNIEIKLKLEEIPDKSYKNDFNYKLYLYSKGIKYKAKALYSKKLSNTISLKRYKYILLDYYETKLSAESFLYVKAMVFAQNDLSDDLKDGYSMLGISHILAISGMHIILIYRFLSLILLKLFKIHRATIPLIIIFIYTMLMGFPLSCLRAVLVLFLSKLNEKGKIQYTRLDILSLSFIIMILINPYYGYNTGFQLSFIVSFLLLFMNDIIKHKNGLIKSYISFYLIFLLTFPIVVSISNKISIFSLLFSPVLSTIIAYIILPISYILAFIPNLDYILKYIFKFLNEYIINLNDISININIMSFSFIMMIIYYLIYIFSIVMLALNKKKYSLSILIYILLIISFKWINPATEVTFIDVNQGDSAIINLSHNRGVMLIDTFNSADYISSLGLDRIDYLVLTHSDNDHIKNADEIIKKYNVKMLIYPKYDNGFIELEALANNSIKADYNNSFYLDDIYIDILGPIYNYNDKNSNSIVLKLEIDGYSFLFTGDMTVEAEYDLINKYGNHLKSDILKVAHHGSNTSSSNEFINLVNPKYSIVSVGKNNIYNLPDNEIISRLEEKSKVLLTSKCGNISFKIYNKKLFLNTYR